MLHVLHLHHLSQVKNLMDKLHLSSLLLLFFLMCIPDVKIYDPAYFGQGDNPVVASGFLCTSVDSILSDCAYSTDFCCGHHRDVSIRCNPGCNDGEIKLSGGSGDLEGTVKVCIKGGFYTICDDGWSNNDATVICRQLGYSVIGM